MSDLEPLIQALCLLGSRSDWVEVKRREQIPLDQVLAVAWSDARLERCRRLLAEGSTPDPIQVSRYRVGEAVYYTLSDGNHRAVAAKMAGHTLIVAEVEGECTCTCDQFAVDEATGWLWKDVSPGVQERVNTHRLSVDEITALKRLGVKAVRF